ncbi:hypothetical protein ACEPAF_931 [Sanghuangporus sanghuang]
MLGTSSTRKKANQTGAQEAPSSIVEEAEIPSKGKVKTAVLASAKLPDLDQNYFASKVAVRSIPKPAAELVTRRISYSLDVWRLVRASTEGSADMETRDPLLEQRRFIFTVSNLKPYIKSLFIRGGGGAEHLTFQIAYRGACRLDAYMDEPLAFHVHLICAGRTRVVRAGLVTTAVYTGAERIADEISEL